MIPDTIVGGVIISLSLCALVTAAVCWVITTTKRPAPDAVTSALGEFTQDDWERHISEAVTLTEAPIRDQLAVERLHADLNDDRAIESWLA